MKKYLVVGVLAVLGSATIFLFAATSTLAQDTPPYSEEYMQQHDGGDRAEYLQEMEYNDPWFYVPPVNDANFQVDDNLSALE